MAAPEWWLDYIDAAVRGERVQFNFSRSVGRREAGKRILEHQLRQGEHVHRVAADGNTYCEGGDPECPLFGIQLREAMQAWQSG